MKSEKFDLRKIINIDKWQKVQDEIALATKMAIILVDYKGIPITAHSHCQEFCQYIRNDERMSKECQKCDSRGGLEASRFNKPYIYTCHCNVIDIAIPIMIEGMYVGALMAGQVLLSTEENVLDAVAKPTKLNFNSKNKELKKYYDMLPKLTFNEINLTSNMLFYLCDYMVEESIKKYDMISVYEKILQNSEDFEVCSLDAMINLKSEMSKNIVKKQLNDLGGFPEHKDKFKNSMLKPALDYMISNKNDNVTLVEMARICNISASHFSRLFTSQMGENFSSYKTRLKIEYAKKLLETTDMPVSSISETLGFNDDGYFIKVFKKFENITPAKYRKYLI